MAMQRIPELYADNLDTLKKVLDALEDLTKIEGLYACEIRVKIDDVESWAVIGWGDAGEPCILRFEDDFEPVLTPSFSDAARITVEAAAPFLTEEAAYHAKCAWEQTDAYYEHLSQQILEAEERAELAEAEVQRLLLTIDSLWATEPWQMADLLAEALRKSAGVPLVDEDWNPNGPSAKQVALAAYEEARRAH